MKLKRDTKIPKYYFIIVLGIVMLFVAVIVGAQFARTKKENERAQKQEQTTQQQTKEPMADSPNYDIDYSKYVVLENRQEFADSLLGNYAAFLDQEVNVFLQENEIEATKAKCIDSYIPYDHPEMTYIYISLDDPAETILEARIKAETRAIKIFVSDLTEEEIHDRSVSQNTNAPAVRDVPEEEGEN